MNCSSDCHTLLSPLSLGAREIPNRVVLGAHRTNLAKNGYPGKKIDAYYTTRAKGGCGLIVIGELTILPNDRPYEKMLEVYSD
jgi:2,4-dienoyl-CoA reductase-like NADH-dependent reductase (Old Yellow Enzyme family)